MNEDVCALTALELSEKFHTGELAPPDVLEAVLARCARINPRLNALVTFDPAGARREAARSATRWHAGTPLSRLDGVPIIIKDNLIVAGMRATWGSRVFEDYVPDADELPVARLRSAGLVFFGKANVPEFTLQGYTDNLLFGPTRNPWDLDLTPGGSSGGAVAAVAAGLASIALATDGGGSIRRPCAHTGLVGLKPSTGRIPRHGGFPPILHDLEVVGPIARDVADIAALMQILAGPDARDPASLRWRTWSEQSGMPRAGRRVLYLPRFGDSAVDAEVESSVAEAVDVLASIGCSIEIAQVPFDIEAVGQAFATISAAGLAWLMRQHPDRRDHLGGAMQALATQGDRVAAADYVAALAVADRLKRQLAALFESYDVLATPSAAALPWAADVSHPETIAGTPVGPRGHAVFTGFANLAGCPGLALPCAPSASGLPIGFQLVGAPNADEALVELGRQYESVRPWRARRPTLQAA